MPDSHRPILIGAAQRSQRDVTLETAESPLTHLTRIAREAAEASGGAPSLVESIDTIALTSTAGWRDGNPPRLIGDTLGAKISTAWVSEVGGETSIALVNDAAARIAAGESRLAFVGGCNNIKSLTMARAAGVDLDWPTGGDGEPTRVGRAGDGSSDAEKAVGLDMPISIYPVLENALRAARGQSLEEHRRAMGELFHPFTKVAARNPHAWFPTERSAEELTTVTPTNRMIGFPYPKYLNAVMATEQSAGVLLASESFARELGIREQDFIYWRGGAFQVEDPWFVSERPSLAEVPALRTCHQTALANAGLALDEIELFDFYSCFPVAVAMACEMLGLAQDDPRGLTLTGGLPYAGGPGSSYPLHPLATAFERLREGAGEHALLTGNGWYLTKHSATVLSRQPGAAAPSVAAPTDATRSGWTAPPVELVAEASGSARVESYTIRHDREGAPERGIVIGRLEDTSQRFLANTPADPELLASLEETELIGTKGHVDHKDGANLYRPS